MSADDRREKLEKLRADGIEPFPHEFPRVVPIERIHEAHDDLADGEETDFALPRRRPHPRPPRPRQGGVHRPGRPLGADPATRARRRARRGVARAAPLARPRRPDRGRRHGVQDAPRRAQPAHRLLGAAREVAARAAREVPRAGGRRDPLPPPRARPDRERGGARAVHPALEGRLVGQALARRARLPRGRDAGAPAALRRRARPAVHDPPQRARQGPLPADRDRALPQAADRRRARAGVRARQGLPQRGHLVQAQPRVHDARVVRGVRRLPPDRRASSRS